MSGRLHSLRGIWELRFHGLFPGVSVIGSTRTWVLALTHSLLSLQTSSICKAAVHAGVIVDEVGGYADVMPVDKKKSYVGSLRNGVQSER